MINVLGQHSLLIIQWEFEGSIPISLYFKLSHALPSNDRFWHKAAEDYSLLGLAPEGGEESSVNIY